MIVIYCLLLLFGVYVGFCPINKRYITVVTWALVVCLYIHPWACGPRALIDFGHKDAIYNWAG